MAGTYGLHAHECRVCGWEWSCTDLDCHSGDLCQKCEDDNDADDDRADVEAAALGRVIRQQQDSSF